MCSRPAARRSLEPAGPVLGPRRVPGRQGDRLHLEEALQTLGAELAPDAGLLVAAERRREVDGHRRVQHVGAGAHPARHPEPAVVVTRPHRAAQPVVGVVGDVDRIVVAVVGDDDEDGPEDLLLGDPHLVVHVGEHRRLHVPALGEVGARRAAAPERDRRALLAPAVEIPLDPAPLPLGHHRADVGRRVHGVAHLHGGHARDDGVDDLGVARAGRQDAGLRDAGLPVVHDGVGQQRGDGRRQVGVVEDDGGRLATQLERAALEALAAEPADTLAADPRAGERDLVHAGVLDQMLADLAAGRHHREDTLGQTRLGEDLGEPEGVEGRLGRRLVDDGAAGGQRRRQLGGGDEERHVPRGDGAHDADRFLGHERLRVQHAGTHLVERVGGGQVGVVAEDHGGCEHLTHAREGDRRSHLPRDDLGHVAHLGGDLRRHGGEDGAPLGRRHPRPGPVVECRPRRRHGLVDVRLGAVGHPGDHLLGRGRDHRNGVGALRGHPVAADEQAVVVPNRHASLPGAPGARAPAARCAGRQSKGSCAPPARDSPSPAWLPDAHPCARWRDRSEGPAHGPPRVLARRSTRG